MKRMLISLLSLAMTAAMFSGISETGLAAGSSPVAENLVPQNSLVREFVGGSSLNY